MPNHLPAASAAFEAGTVGTWSSAAPGLCSVASSTAFARSGSRSLKVTILDTFGTQPSFHTTQGSGGFWVPQAKELSFGGWYRLGDGVAPGTMLAYLLFYDSSGNQISFAGWLQATEVAGGWNSFSGTTTSPPNVAYAAMQIVVQTHSTPNVGDARYYDDFWVESETLVGEDVFYVSGGPSSGGVSHISKYRFSDGALLDRNTSSAINGTGGAIDPKTGDPWWTNFSNNTVLRASANSLASLTTVVTSSGNNVESLVFREDHFYTGTADGNQTVKKYTRNGSLVASYPVAVNRGSDWISLHPDNKTLYYTSESGTIFRYDIETNTQLPSFAHLGGTLFTVIVRQSDRHVIVGGNNRIYHLDADGVLLATYYPSPTPYVFAVCLDLSERTLVVGDYSSNAVWKIDLETGAGQTPPFFYQPGGESMRSGGVFSLGGNVSMGWVVGAVGFR